MSLLLHISPHWAGEFSTFEWSIITMAIAIGTMFAFIYAFWKNTPTTSGNQIYLGNNNDSRITLAMKFLVIYGLIAVGMALQIGGGKWDVTWHMLQKPETFFTPPHAVLYSGVGLVVSAAATGFYHVTIRSRHTDAKNSLLLAPIFLAIVGSIVQILAGAFDFTWHSTFGFDGLLSPPHALLVSGMVINSLAAVKGLVMLNQSTDYSSKGISVTTATKLSMALALAVLWMCSVALLDLYTYPWSKGEHFDFNPNPQIAALTGTILYPLIGPFMGLLALRVLPIKYPFTLVTAIYVIIILFANIIPDKSLHMSIPFYALLPLPAFAADNIYKARSINSGKVKLVAVGAIFGPFFLGMYFPGIIAIYQQPLGMTVQEGISVEYPVFLPLVYQTELWILLIPSVLAGIIGSMMGSKAGGRWLKKQQQTYLTPPSRR
jgi:hypothetical protein